MNDRVAKLLRDALEHGEKAQRYVADYTFAQYMSHDLLRSGVERELSIVGEALQQMRRLDVELADSVPEIAEVIGLRNRLVHGYQQTDDRVVYDTMRDPLADLLVALRVLLEGR